MSTHPNLEAASPQGRLYTYITEYRARVSKDPSPYSAFNLTPQSTWEEVQTKYQEFKDIFREQDIDSVKTGVLSMDELSRKTRDAFTLMSKAYEQLQEQYPNRAEYLSEAESITSLMRRLQILVDSGESFLTEKSGTEEERLISLQEVLLMLEEKLYDVFKHPENEVSGTFVADLPEAHNIRALTESKLLEFQTIVKEMRTAVNLEVKRDKYKLLVRQGYDRIKIPTSRGEYFLDFQEKIAELDQMIAQNMPEKRPVFAQAVLRSGSALSGNRTHI